MQKWELNILNKLVKGSFVKHINKEKKYTT